MNERFKELRKALKLTQTEIGKAIGKGLRAVQHYEAGERKIDEATLLLLEKEFNVNKDWLLTGIGDMFLPAEPELGQMSPAQKLIMYAILKMGDTEVLDTLKYIEQVASRDKSSDNATNSKKKIV